MLNDFRSRRKRSAATAGLTPGLEWKIFVDGKLTRRRTAFQAHTNSKTHIFGDLEFADDTATIATETEFPMADHLLEQTFTDWGEKLNRSKTETLILKPGTPPAQRCDPPQQHNAVRHVGGIISDTGSQWKDTIHRCIQARRRIKEIAKACSTGTERGRGQTSRVGLLARLRVMRSIILPTLTSFGRTRTWTKAQIEALQTVQNYALQRVFGLDRLALHELHITNEQLHKAALWPPIRTVLMRQTMRWLGHICRMQLHRLPKMDYSVPGYRTHPTPSEPTTNSSGLARLWQLQIFILLTSSDSPKTWMSPNGNTSSSEHSPSLASPWPLPDNSTAGVITTPSPTTAKSGSAAPETHGTNPQVRFQ